MSIKFEGIAQYLSTYGYFKLLFVLSIGCTPSVHLLKIIKLLHFILIIIELKGEGANTYCIGTKTPSPFKDIVFVLVITLGIQARCYVLPSYKEPMPSLFSNKFPIYITRTKLVKFVVSTGGKRRTKMTRSSSLKTRTSSELKVSGLRLSFSSTPKLKDVKFISSIGSIRWFRSLAYL